MTPETRRQLEAGGWSGEKIAAAERRLVERSGVDPEYADVDEAGQLTLGVPGEQRAIPGLARPRDDDEEVS